MATNTRHEISKTAEDTARNARHTARAMTEYVGRVGAINTEMAGRMAEIWVEGFRKQTELSQRTTLQLFDRSIEQAYNSEDSFDPLPDLVGALHLRSVRLLARVGADASGNL